MNNAWMMHLSKVFDAACKYQPSSLNYLLPKFYFQASVLKQGSTATQDWDSVDSKYNTLI